MLRLCRRSGRNSPDLRFIYRNDTTRASNNGSGTSTLYNGYGAANALIVQIPSAGGIPSGGPVSGVIYSAGSGFSVVAGSPASFLFCAEDGVISGWNSTLDSTHARIMLDNSASGAVYKAAPGCAPSQAALSAVPVWRESSCRVDSRVVAPLPAILFHRTKPREETAPRQPVA
jgi:hypothetical protein